MSKLLANMTAKRLQSVLLALTALFLAGSPLCCQAGVAVIGHEGLGAMDKTLISRIFTGRSVQVEGRAVQPFNLKASDPTRASFLRAVLQQSDDDYVAYWIVRRAIGKGAPPQEVDNDQAMVDVVRSTPGALGYIDEAHLIPEVKVLLLLP